MSKYQGIVLSNYGRWRLLCIISANLSMETVLKLAVQCSRRKKMYDIGGEKLYFSFIKLLLIRYFKDFVLLIPQVILFGIEQICHEVLEISFY